MAVRVWTGSAFNSVTPKYWDGSAWAVPAFVRVWTGSVWQVVFTRFTASVAPTALSGTATPTGGPGFTFYTGQTTAPAIVTTEGGQAPVTVAWERVSGSTSIVPQTPNGLSTLFRFSRATAPTLNESAVYQCRLTDANGAELVTGTVTATFN